MKTIFRLILSLVALGAILFGVWYYMNSYEMKSVVHGTLVREWKERYVADEEECDCFLQKNEESRV